MENKITFEDASKEWIVQKLRKDDMDALIIDNWYSNDELKKVFIEMDYYMNLGLDNLIRSEKDKSSARDYNGESKVKSYRFYVEPNIYSALYKYSYKYVFEEFKNMLQNETLFGGYFSNTRSNSIMVNYYENDKYYKSHKDVSVITQLTWIYREPKMFTGGDLILTDMDETIECKNNRTIFFPGHYKHEVMEVKMKDEWEREYKDKNYYGRFSIANFFQN